MPNSKAFVDGWGYFVRVRKVGLFGSLGEGEERAKGEERGEGRGEGFLGNRWVRVFLRSRVKLVEVLSVV